METISGKFLFNENTAETKCVNCNKRGYFSLLSHDCENNNDSQVEELVKTTRKQSKNWIIFVFSKYINPIQPGLFYTVCCRTKTNICACKIWAFNQAGFFPANPWTLFTGNVILHRKSELKWLKEQEIINLFNKIEHIFV